MSIHDNHYIHSYMYMYIYMHPQSYHSILLAPSLSPLSLICIFISDMYSDIRMCMYIKTNYNHDFLYPTPKILAGDVGVRRWSSEARGWNSWFVDPWADGFGAGIQHEVQRLEMTGETTWNASHGMKPSNCDIPWGFYSSAIFSIQDFTEQKLEKRDGCHSQRSPKTVERLLIGQHCKLRCRRCGATWAGNEKALMLGADFSTRQTTTESRIQQGVGMKMMKIPAAIVNAMIQAALADANCI